MPNVAGKAYALNVITPMKRKMARLYKLLFRVLPFFPKRLQGWIRLSSMQSAQWVILDKWVHIDASQPRESLRHAYMLFFGNVNGSGLHYMESLANAAPQAVDLFWQRQLHYPGTAPVKNFLDYFHTNQIETDHYFHIAPNATVNDLRSAKRVQANLIQLINFAESSPEAFMIQYKHTLLQLQFDLGTMGPAPATSDQGKSHD